MDQFDRATALEEAEREACVAKARNQPGMPPTGLCHNCGEPLGDELLFCLGGECRDDYEKRQARR